jgi:hypothetical protein
MYKIGRLSKIERPLSKPDVFFKNNQKQFTEIMHGKNRSLFMVKKPNVPPHEIRSGFISIGA